MTSADEFAYDEYHHGLIYRTLAVHEPVPEFKLILRTLAEHEDEHLKFWLQYSTRKTFSVHRLELVKYRILRRIFGLTFIAQYLERTEEEMSKKYGAYLAKTSDPAMRATIRSFITMEEDDERQLIGQIKEDRVVFVSNIILGLNDGLIELTGALVGFSSALQDPLAVAMAGGITGISATLSMAASAYQQARHDPERMRNPGASALYTGVAYGIIVVLLIFPFLFFGRLETALSLMFAVIIVIIMCVSWYTAVLFGRSFHSQAIEMLAFSMGVALIAFLIGSLFRTMTGIEL